MKRSITVFIVTFPALVIPGLSQSLTAPSNDDSSVYPLIIALIMLVGAIFTRLLSKSQSRKQSF